MLLFLQAKNKEETIGKKQVTRYVLLNLSQHSLLDPRVHLIFSITCHLFLTGYFLLQHYFKHYVRSLDGEIQVAPPRVLIANTTKVSILTLTVKTVSIIPACKEIMMFITILQSMEDNQSVLLKVPTKIWIAAMY